MKLIEAQQLIGGMTRAAIESTLFKCLNELPSALFELAYKDSQTPCTDPHCSACKDSKEIWQAFKKLRDKGNESNAPKPPQHWRN